MASASASHKLSSCTASWAFADRSEGEEDGAIDWAWREDECGVKNGVSSSTLDASFTGVLSITPTAARAMLQMALHSRRVKGNWKEPCVRYNLHTHTTANVRIAFQNSHSQHRFLLDASLYTRQGHVAAVILFPVWARQTHQVDVKPHWLLY
jgi:hypothetical protein